LFDLFKWLTGAYYESQVKYIVMIQKRWLNIGKKRQLQIFLKNPGNCLERKNFTTRLQAFLVNIINILYSQWIRNTILYVLNSVRSYSCFLRVVSYNGRLKFQIQGFGSFSNKYRIGNSLSEVFSVFLILKYVYNVF